MGGHLSPVLTGRSTCPQRGRSFACWFFSWTTKGGLILCTLMSNNYLLAFTHVQSRAFCAELPAKWKRKKHLWSGELEPGESGRTVSGAFKQQQRSPGPWACPCHTCQMLRSWIYILISWFKMFSAGPKSMDVQNGCSIHRKDCYSFGVKVCCVQFCIQICSCNYMLDWSPGS